MDTSKAAAITECEGMIAEHQAVAAAMTAGMAAGLEYARGGPNPWGSLEAMDAAIAELLAASPSLVAAITGTPPRRNRLRPLREAAEEALAVIYRGCIPSRAIVSDKRLVSDVCEHMITVMGIAIARNDDGAYSAARTVLRAAGRRK